MNHGLVLALLAGCAGQPGEILGTNRTTAPAPAAHCAVSAAMIGPDEPALGATPAELLAGTTGSFAGVLSTSEGEVPLSLDIEAELGEIQLVTRTWEGDGPADHDCRTTVEAAFTGRLLGEESAIDSAFTAVFVADGGLVTFAADLMPSEVEDADLTGASTAESLRLVATLQQPELWAGWLTWGAETDAAAWFEVEAY